jgi:hypothetical protein
MIDLIFFLQGDDDTYHFDRLTDTRTSTWKEGRMGSSSQVSGLGRLLHVPTCISRYIPTITGHSGLPPCRMNDLCLTLVRRDRFSHLALESQTPNRRKRGRRALGRILSSTRASRFELAPYLKIGYLQLPCYQTSNSTSYSGRNPVRLPILAANSANRRGSQLSRQAWPYYSARRLQHLPPS